MPQDSSEVGFCCIGQRSRQGTFSSTDVRNATSSEESSLHKLARQCPATKMIMKNGTMLEAMFIASVRSDAPSHQLLLFVCNDEQLEEDDDFLFLDGPIASTATATLAKEPTLLTELFARLRQYQSLKVLDRRDGVVRSFLRCVVLDGEFYLIMSSAGAARRCYVWCGRPSLALRATESEIESRLATAHAAEFDWQLPQMFFIGGDSCQSACPMADIRYRGRYFGSYRTKDLPKSLAELESRQALRGLPRAEGSDESPRIDSGEIDISIWY